MDPNAKECKKKSCIEQIARDLPVLRARLDISQEQVAERIGVSRQTYNSIESGRRSMTWNTCVSLVTLFASYESTKQMMKTNGSYLQLCQEILKGE